MGFRIKRVQTDHVYFSNWADYLEHRADIADESLCRIMRDNTSLLNQQVVKSLQDLVNDTRELLDKAELAGEDAQALRDDLAFHEEQLKAPKRRAAFPWITPVLGTGCLSTSEFSGLDDVGLMPARMQSEASGFDDNDSRLDGNDSAEVSVFDFAEKLVQSRAPQAKVQRPLLTDDELSFANADGHVTLAAHAAFVAAMMTRLFYQIAALTSRPIGHWSEQTSLPKAGEIEDESGIRSLVVPKLVEALLEFAGLVRAHNELRFLFTYLEKLASRVRDVKFSLVDVQLLTEVTWHLMMRDTERYAGWSDLLAIVGIKSRSYGPDRRVPTLDDLGSPTGLVSWLIKNLSETTANSWKSRLADATSDREKFYDAIAAMLIEQANLDSERFVNTEDAHHYLPGVAFVTSFDLELEMALHSKRQKFVLVAPFELWGGLGTERRAHLAWFYRVIETPDHLAPSLAALKGEGEWHLLRENSLRPNEFGDYRNLRGIPIIVRLTGCPLVSAPQVTVDMNAELSKASFPGSQARLDVGHAVLLDEHISLHHWTAELRETIRLPRELIGNELGNESINADRRFWMLLGVQITDDAVRHRIAAVVAAQSIRSDYADAELETPLTGVVVNQRSEPSQRDIFQWQGLDVIEGYHTDVLSAVRHYTMHLKKPESRPVQDEECSIGTGDVYEDQE